jgi:DNA-directed RNA polymerase subunit RPC12/RpoP
MKGAHKFSPTSGAKLSRDRHYPGTLPLREALDGSGELSNGKLVSDSSTALARYFKRIHQRRHDTADGRLYQAAALGIARLRAKDPWDCWLWYTLAERLHRKGFDTEWMLDHVEARCPRCSSRLQYEPTPTGYVNALCASSCGADSNNRTVEIVERILDLYEAAFDDAINSITLFDS